MVGHRCPRCQGQMLPDDADKDAISCLQCGHVIYTEQAMDEESDRRNLTDNRQAENPFEEYRRALSPEDFARMMREIGINDPAKD